MDSSILAQHVTSCGCGDTVCQKEKESVGPLATQALAALGEHIVVTEEVAAHRRASRSSVEASDLRRAVAGTETPPAR
jgi:hypothetical protein